MTGSSGSSAFLESNPVAVETGGDLLEPEQVADAVVNAIDGRHFLILPYPSLAEAERGRSVDDDGWLNGEHQLWRTESTYFVSAM